MSAAILAWPMAAPAPVMQRRRRGPLPKAVQSLSVYRRARQQEREDLAAANLDGVKKLCFEVLKRAADGEISGLVVIESRGGEQWEGYSTGDLGMQRPEDLTRLVSSVEWLAQAVSDTAARRQK